MRGSGPTVDGLKFLGTAGARHVVARQVRHSGGIVYTLGRTRIWVDPGPGALVRALSSRPRVDPATVDVLLLTIVTSITPEMRPPSSRP